MRENELILKIYMNSGKINNNISLLSSKLYEVLLFIPTYHQWILYINILSNIFLDQINHSIRKYYKLILLMIVKK